jgi:hypothetical protein
MSTSVVSTVAGTGEGTLSYSQTEAVVNLISGSGILWANRKAASTVPGLLQYFSDLGAYLRSDGTNWKSPNPITLFQWSVPISFATTGTVATNGTFTNTTLVLTYSSGLWMYFPAGAITDPDVGSAAGWYWCVFSSATAGQVKKNYSAALGIPIAPAVVGANAVGSNSAFTGQTASVVNAIGTLPGGAMGIAGSLRISTLMQATNNSNAKIIALTANGSQWGASLLGVSAAGREVSVRLTNLGDVTKQGMLNTPALSLAAGAVNTAADVTVGIIMSRATDTDALTLLNGVIELLPMN